MALPRRIALLGAALIVVGLLVPVLIPADRDYRYSVEREPASEVPDSVAPVPYENLTEAEREVFDTALERGENVRRERKVDGPHYTYAEHEVGFGQGWTAVERDGRSYVVDASVVRSNFALRYWGRPLLVALGLVAELAAVCAFAVQRLSGRRRGSSSSG